MKPVSVIMLVIAGVGFAAQSAWAGRESLRRSRCALQESAPEPGIHAGVDCQLTTEAAHYRTRYRPAPSGSPEKGRRSQPVGATQA
jgi:hypothetical protein